MKIVMNEKRNAIIKTLTAAEKPLTLAEISAQANMEIASGSMNALVKAGIVLVAGDRTIECPVCHRRRTVKEYTIGDISKIK